MLTSRNIWLAAIAGAFLAAGGASVLSQVIQPYPPGPLNGAKAASRPDPGSARKDNPFLTGAATASPADRLAAAPQPIPPDLTNAVVLFDGRQKLTPGDVIDVKVYQEDELACHGRIETDGTVTMPLLGVVAVGGKTAMEASMMIQDMLARDYLVHPYVTLTVSEFAKKRFSVMGEVKVPGFYVIPDSERINLLQALSMAGGFTAFSRGTRIQVKRQINGSDVVMWVDAKAMARKKSTALMEILPGDAITVNPNIF